MKKFEVVREYFTCDFIRKVNELLNKGYKLRGPMLFTEKDYVQDLILDDEEFI